METAKKKKQPARWLPALMVCLAATSVRAGEPAGLPPYPAGASRVVSGRMLANLAPLDAQVLETSDPIEKILEFYRRQLEDADIEYTTHWFNPGLAYIGYFDHQDRTMKMATMLRAAPDTTWIIYSSMNPLEALFGQNRIPEDLPALSQASGVVVTEDEIGGKKSISVSFVVAGMKPIEVRNQIAKNASSLGWKAVSAPGASAGEEFIVLERKDEFCTVQIVEGQDQDGKMVVVVSYLAVLKKKEAEK